MKILTFIMRVQTVLALLFLFDLVSFIQSICRKKIYPHMTKLKYVSIEGHDVGDPLFLTPLIYSGKLKEAKMLSRVGDYISNEVESYSGFLTVNAKYNSNIFFWYFPVEQYTETPCLLVWLQGGPGGSSLFGLFTENGPFIINSKFERSYRNLRWNKICHIVYFDNPVGTGFSFTDRDEGFARNEDDVARDLYSALVQFYMLFYELIPLPLYLTGESYAGKYIPSLAYKIHTENQGTPKVFINLKGVAIGNGFTDPPNMLNYGEVLNGLGLIDENQREYFQQQEDHARYLILGGRFIDAANIMNDLIDGPENSYTAWTGISTYYNMLTDLEPPFYYDTYVQRPYSRKALHVGNQNFSNLADIVEKYLEPDMYQSVVDKVKVILNALEKYQILFYNGQLDVICANLLTENWLAKMEWHGDTRWHGAERHIWKLNNTPVGYIKGESNLYHVTVRNAGHMVPADQPEVAFEMIKMLVTGQFRQYAGNGEYYKYK